MPGRMFLTTPVDRIAALLKADCADLGLEPPRRNIAPEQEIVVCTENRRLVRMRWGILPVGRVNARGRPVMETLINARSETLFEKSAYAGVRRAIVPADGWYEWTGTRGRKTAWEICARSGEPLWFAAISDLWTAPGGRQIWQAATVTCPPSDDVRDIHDRMGVLLANDALDTWLAGDPDAARGLMRPAPAGSLLVSEARDVDWSGP